MNLFMDVFLNICTLLSGYLALWKLLDKREMPNRFLWNCAKWGYVLLAAFLQALVSQLHIPWLNLVTIAISFVGMTKLFFRCNLVPLLLYDTAVMVCLFAADMVSSLAVSVSAGDSVSETLQRTDVLLARYLLLHHFVFMLCSIFPLFFKRRELYEIYWYEVICLAGCWRVRDHFGGIYCASPAILFLGAVRDSLHDGLPGAGHLSGIRVLPAGGEPETGKGILADSTAVQHPAFRIPGAVTEIRRLRPNCPRCQETRPCAGRSCAERTGEPVPGLHLCGAEQALPGVRNTRIRCFPSSSTMRSIVRSATASGWICGSMMQTCPCFRTWI